ncbi:MAG TPA: glycine cleavage system protein H [Planctomycetota bacterium]|nr:glycine cleavage system protein H [Planctomycetota bacterium]
MQSDCDRFIFEMGLYKASIPKGLLYSEIHFWFQPSGPSRTRIGLTSYAARLLTDLFRIDWKVYAGEQVQAEQCLGEVESTKAASELYSPMSGKLVDINAAAVNDPSIVSLQPYENWLLEFEGVPERVMQPQEYIDFLAAGWEETVKMLKGQV